MDSCGSKKINIGLLMSLNWTYLDVTKRFFEVVFEETIGGGLAH